MEPTSLDFSTVFDEREMKVLEEAMSRKDMSARAVVRHFFRMGQMTDIMQQKGYRVLYTKDDEVYDPLNTGPKMAPMPNPVNSCNRHSDCAAANKSYLDRHPGETYAPPNFHCHDDECEDCFGS